MREIRVNLGDRSYPVYIGSGIVSSFGEVCKSAHLPQRAVLVTDANVARLYLRHVSNALKHLGFSVNSIVMTPGEHQKSIRRAQSIITKLIGLGAGRDSLLVALGGGVVGDVTGFVAANFRRGVAFVQCPTTLLSQVDSSIGGKVGVNHPRAKNAIGTFYQPRLVFSDVSFLRSLPKREVVSGIGEILKYGIVAGKEMFDFLKSNVKKILDRDLDIIQETIARCVSVKAKLVEADERETQKDGGRGVLNVGHAVGQTLETLSQFTLRHGEAVLLGLRVESAIAKELDVLSEKDFDAIHDYLHLVEFGFTMGHRHGGAPLFSIDRLVRELLRSKFVLPAGIGKVEFRTNVPQEVLGKTVRSLLHST